MCFPTRAGDKGPIGPVVEEDEQESLATELRDNSLAYSGEYSRRGVNSGGSAIEWYSTLS